MAITPEGLLVPDSAILPVEKETVTWTLSEVKAFERAANAMINHRLSFMVLCAPCGIAGRDSTCTATGDGNGSILIECDCTVHVLKGPKAYRKAEN
jgi:hypothetical protein